MSLEKSKEGYADLVKNETHDTILNLVLKKYYRLVLFNYTVMYDFQCFQIIGSEDIVRKTSLTGNITKDCETLISYFEKELSKVD